MTYSVSLEQEVRVRVRVMDVTGRVVDRLVDENLPAGLHSFAWSAVDGDGRGVPAGVYYLALEANGERQTRKFVVMK